jgi:hypothetical protein
MDCMYGLRLQLVIYSSFVMPPSFCIKSHDDHDHDHDDHNDADHHDHDHHGYKVGWNICFVSCGATRRNWMPVDACWCTCTTVVLSWWPGCSDMSKHVVGAKKRRTKGQKGVRHQKSCAATTIMYQFQGCRAKELGSFLLWRRPKRTQSSYNNTITTTWGSESRSAATSVVSMPSW